MQAAHLVLDFLKKVLTKRNTENRSTQSDPVSCLSGLVKSEGQYLKRDIAPVVCIKRYCSG